MICSPERASADLQCGRVRAGFRGTSCNRLITWSFLAWWGSLSTGSTSCCKTESFLFTIRLRFNRHGRAVYVCLCNCVTDQQLVEAAAEVACDSGTECSASLAEQVADRLGAGLGCGSCREFALDLVNRVATQQSSVVLPNRISIPIGFAGSRQGTVDRRSSTLPPGAMAPLRTRKREAVASPGNHVLLGTASTT